ncbi:MAG TPA: TIGR01459 family HAD-type hydrolase [Rhizomicrobium sp.]|nr:TIGR01459 family HAD-type hydrolase [Rhizomicrobium sp.]
MPLPQILSGLADISEEYDALICDVWGVIHNGHRANAQAVYALRQFRDSHGKVVLLSNAPRPKADLEQQFQKYGVPPDCYDEIVTSGIATRLDLEARSKDKRLRMFHLGPERDRGIFEGLNVELTDVETAELVLNSGLFNDDVETPETYDGALGLMRDRDLLMLCANPDQVVQRGGKLIWCAGALAGAYEKIGGNVTYYGKPKPEIYDLVRASLDGAERVLAIGDGMQTDIKGANAVGIDALFIADGIHGEDVGDMSAVHLGELFSEAGVEARAAMRALVW